MFDISSVQFPDLVGIAGCALYILNYSLLTVRRMYGETITYFMLNLGAASCVLLSLTSDFNLAAVVIQSFWICASLVAIAIRLHRRRQAVWQDAQSRAAVSRTT